MLKMFMSVAMMMMKILMVMGLRGWLAHALLRPEEALDGSMDPGPPYGAGPCDPHMDPSLLDLRNYGGPMAGPHGMGPPEPPMGPLDLGPGPPDHQGQHGSPKYICL